MSKIDNLNPIAKRQILEFLPIQDLCAFRLVSKQWRADVDANRMRQVGVLSDESASTFTRMTLTLSNFQFDEMIVENFLKPIQESLYFTYDGLSKLLFKNQNRITLTSSLQNIEILMRINTNIRQIEFYRSLHLESLINFEGIVLNHLTHFSITIGSENVWFLEGAPIFVCLQLLKMQSLTNLKIIVEPCPDDKNQIVTSIYTFVSLQAKSLKVLEVFLDRHLNFWNHRDDNFPTNYPCTFDELDLLRSNLSQIQLDVLTLSINASENDHCHNLGFSLLGGQTNLKILNLKLNVDSFDQSSLIVLKAIDNNSSSLRQLNISGHPDVRDFKRLLPSPEELQHIRNMLIPIEKCVKLESLELYGLSIEKAYPLLIQHLPKALLQFKIADSLTFIPFKHIVTIQPHLKHLLIYNANPSEQDYSLFLYDVIDMLKNFPKLQLFKIFCSAPIFNLSHFSSTIPSTSISVQLADTSFDHYHLHSTMWKSDDQD